MSYYPLDLKSQQNATAEWENSLIAVGKYSIVWLKSQLVFLSFLFMTSGMISKNEYNTP